MSGKEQNNNSYDPGEEIVAFLTQYTQLLEIHLASVRKTMADTVVALMEKVEDINQKAEEKKKLAGGVLIVPHNTISDGLLFLPLILEARRFAAAPVRALAIVALIPVLPPGALQVAVILLLLAALRNLYLKPAAPGGQPAAAAA